MDFETTLKALQQFESIEELILAYLEAKGLDQSFYENLPAETQSKIEYINDDINELLS